ncbi:HmuY family protein [Stigmatella sp. ncwal1]|uniref:HmuY family protein n=1 Tax=Stigmatella ashevillensis TaxID=2995309 RepID=A0ABT5D1E5_9BACT|nr:HmuY family protein [Stigmatella ashevillena]MDC0707487.1 HmuY family protein [Stigmatella ashevillena]
MYSSPNDSMRKRGQSRFLPAFALLVMSLALVNCSEDDDSSDAEPEPKCAPAAVRCTEESIDLLDLLTTVSTGAMREDSTTAGEFHTYVDARAGGSPQTQSYTYARFTKQGLTRVEIDDQAALASMNWDISFRRFIIRVNSGVSGPSCTLVARTPDGTTFESVTTVDSSWEFKSEGYLTETCELITHEAGLGPATEMGSFWTYQSCLAMSGNVFVVRLADGRHVKIQVTHYYDPEPQEVCNRTGSAPAPNGAAQVRVRWAFLP